MQHSIFNNRYTIIRAVQGKLLQWQGFDESIAVFDPETKAISYGGVLPTTLRSISNINNTLIPIKYVTSAGISLEKVVSLTNQELGLKEMASRHGQHIDLNKLLLLFYQKIQSAGSDSSRRNEIWQPHSIQTKQPSEVT